MTSLWRGAAFTLLFACMTQVGASAAPPAVASKPKAVAPRVEAALAPAPKFIRDRVDQLGRGFAGRVGIAVRSVDDSWMAGWKAGELYPQQSVSKLWVAIAALDAADRGRVDLDGQVTLTRDDLTLFHQPLRNIILERGRYTTTLNDLMFKAITTSDNTANDKLMRSVGGPEAVRSMIVRKQLGAIRFYNGERALQSKIAGLIWTPSYSIGRSFYEARDALPLSVRRAAFNRYIEDPYDGASPAAITGALAKLKRGELLSPESTRRLLWIMSNTKTGANRLKGGLRPGWTLSHKTGTGQELGGEQAGYNDIGILTAPDGSSYTVAVMIKRTSVPLTVRMTLMNNVVRAVIQQHEQSRGLAVAAQ